MIEHVIAHRGKQQGDSSKGNRWPDDFPEGPAAHKREENGEQEMGAIIDELEKFAPHMMEAYPSTAYESGAAAGNCTTGLCDIPFVYTGSGASLSPSVLSSLSRVWRRV